MTDSRGTRRDGRALAGSRRLVCAGVAGGALLCAPSAALGVAPAEAVGLLNTLRAAEGLPAAVQHLPALSEGCQKHNLYMALNGFRLTHTEVPTLPGYTPEGARQGDRHASSEVLARGGRWGPASTPWDVSPGHRYLVMAPTVQVAGYFESHGFQCMRLRRDPAGLGSGPVTFHSVPSNGRGGVPLAHAARSETGIPQTLVGIPAGQTTGPNLLLFSTGLGAGLRAVEASLAGPNGPVEVRMVDETTGPGAALYAGGGVMIPVQPLTPGTYAARVVWQTRAGASATQELSFTTEGAAAPPPTSTGPPPGAVSPLSSPGAVAGGPDGPAGPVAPARSTTPPLELGPGAPVGRSGSATTSRISQPPLRRVRVVRIGKSPAVVVWLRRRAVVSVRVERRPAGRRADARGPVVRRLGGRRLGAGAHRVVLGKLAGGRYRLRVTLVEADRSRTTATRDFRLAVSRR